MRPAVHLLSPTVQLVLEVQVVREEPTRLEVRAQEPMLTLRLPLRLSITSIKDDPANLHLTAERQNRPARLSAAGDRSLAIPDQLRRAYPKPRDRARQPGEDV